MRKTSCYESCCFHREQYVRGCQSWTEHALFPQPTPVPGPQLNQHKSRGEAGEDRHFQELQVGSWLVTDFGAIYHVDKNNVNSLHSVVGKTDRHKWPEPEDVYDTDTENVVQLI